jgi:hypothetical protein
MASGRGFGAGAPVYFSISASSSNPSIVSFSRSASTVASNKGRFFASVSLQTE